MVAVTEFMDVTCTESLQNAKSLKIFKDIVVQGQGLVNCVSIKTGPRKIIFRHNFAKTTCRLPTYQYVFQRGSLFSYSLIVTVKLDTG